jgi:photosystem II stability/assembly factor-like uncharacterized protein
MQQITDIDCTIRKDKRQDKEHMKNFTPYLLALLLLPAIVKSQGWTNVNIPLTEPITGISFVSRDTGYIVTATGKVAGTTDGAKTWSIGTVAKNMVFEDVCFVNGKRGFICGRKGMVFRTVDGGLSWTPWSSGDTAHYFSCIEMKDSLTGYLIGLHRKPDNPMTSVAYRTSDGGKTWQPSQTVGMGYAQMTKAYGKLFLLSFGTLHNSSDFGKTWNSNMTTNGDPGRALAIKGKTGIIGGSAGMRSYSSDSGKTWQLAKPDSGNVFIAAELIDEQTGYMGGAPSALYVTNNGGLTWGRELPARQFDILDFCLIEDRLYAVGAKGGIVYKKVR